MKDIITQREFEKAALAAFNYFKQGRANGKRISVPLSPRFPRYGEVFDYDTPLNITTVDFDMDDCIINGRPHRGLFYHQLLVHSVPIPT